jgi:diacylglycerol kinase (ATP)
VKICVLVNAKSRSGGDGSREVAITLSENSIDPLAIEVCADPSQLNAVFQKMIAMNPEAIFVGGGDGTQCAAAESLMGTRIALGVIPLGTGNSLARELDIPLNTEDSVKALITGKTKSIDLGEVTIDGVKSIFSTVATMGLTGQIVDSLTRESREKLGVFSYAPAIYQALRQSSQIPVKVNGSATYVLANQIVVSNGRLHAGVFKVSESASICDGLLSGYVLHDSGILRILRYGVELARGQQGSLGTVDEFESCEFRLETRNPTQLIVDGEPKKGKEFIFRSLPNALSVIVPRM